MAHQPTDWLTSNLATVAMAAGAIAFKQLAFDGQPIELLSVLLGAGLVMGYLEWRRRQGDPGLTPERLAQTGPAPGGLAKVPAVAAFVVGAFCLLQGVAVILLLCLFFAAVRTRVKPAGREEAAPPLSQVLGELLIVDAGTPKPGSPVPSLPTPTPVVREAAPSRAKNRAAEVPRAVVASEPAEAPVPVAEVAPPPPLGTTGLPLSWPSTLGTGLPLSLESRLPSVLETHVSTSGSSLGGSVSGFDEALALLQGKPMPTERAD